MILSFRILTRPNEFGCMTARKDDTRRFCYFCHMFCYFCHIFCYFCHIFCYFCHVFCSTNTFCYFCHILCYLCHVFCLLTFFVTFVTFFTHDSLPPTTTTKLLLGPLSVARGQKTRDREFSWNSSELGNL